MTKWRKISTAPRNGDMFIARSRARGSQRWSSSYPMCRRVTFDATTNEVKDLGAWVMCAAEGDGDELGQTGTWSFVNAIAPDKHNTDVEYQWVPFP